jgi:hypothetical protein
MEAVGSKRQLTCAYRIYRQCYRAQGPAIASNAALCDDKVSRRVKERTLEALERAGLIKIEVRGKGRAPQISIPDLHHRGK